jgi:CO/xanthine dehydrogenase FAD-binding subunit
MPKIARYDLAVANLRVAPVSGTGGNLCFADPHSGAASLLIVAGASLPTKARLRSPPLQHGPGPSCVKIRFADHL